MAIEGLYNIPGIPPVKREERPSLNRKNKERKRKKGKRDRVDEDKDREGGHRVDIRI